ncbi:MAG: dihydroneopterin aldolase [Rickettsiaceae bacterium]|nr:dihydroneopterin aldolase [Rickettsiaceae bacterium]MDP5083215.1 dihydroneopterin aldolase [Rickettsiaceae bacterium]
MRYTFNNNSSNLIISDLRLWVHLGCSEQEKHHAQCVSFDINIVFSAAPQGTISDNLKDAFCYAEATKLIKTTIENKRYNLIEHLAADIHAILAASLKQQKFNDTELSVTVIKLSPPVTDIHGGVSFTYSS